MKKFPRGYKQYKVLEFVYFMNGATYTDIVKYAYELTYGKGTFDKKLDRGYWSSIFKKDYSTPWHKGVAGWGTRFFEKRGDMYYLSDEGKKKLDELREKFKPEAQGIEDVATVKELTGGLEPGDEVLFYSAPTPGSLYDTRELVGLGVVDAVNVEFGQKGRIQGASVKVEVVKSNDGTGEGFLKQGLKFVEGDTYEILFKNALTPDERKKKYRLYKVKK